MNTFIQQPYKPKRKYFDKINNEEDNEFEINDEIQKKHEALEKVFNIFFNDESIFIAKV